MGLVSTSTSGLLGIRLWKVYNRAQVVLLLVAVVHKFPIVIVLFEM